MKRKNILSVLTSLILGLTTIVKLEINDEVNFINNFHFDFIFFLKALGISIIYFIILKLLLKYTKNLTLNQTKKTIFSKKVLIISSCGIFLNGLLFLLTYYPGSNMYDTLAIIEGPVSVATQHPLFYNLALSLTYNIFYKIFANMNLAYFLTSLIQLIIMDIIITYLIYYFNKEFKNRYLTISLLIYFIFLPIISNYNSTLIKDVPFCGTILLLIPLLHKLITTKGHCLKDSKYLKILILISILNVFVRNNGLYVIIFTFLILLIIYKKYYKALLKALVIIVICSFIPNLFLEEKPLFQEKVGIPLQQLSYVIKNDSTNINKDDLAYLNRLMPLEEIRKNYNPHSVDEIKWNPSFNRAYLDSTKGQFLKVWFKLLPTHFESYVKSYLLQTNSLFTWEKFNPLQSRFLGIDKTDFYHPEKFASLENKALFPKKIQKALETFYEHTIIFFNNGICFWILIINILILIEKDKPKYIICSLPLLGIWLTLMISSPLAYALRYMSPYLYSLPFILSLTFIKEEKLSK